MALSFSSFNRHDDVDRSLGTNTNLKPSPSRISSINQKIFHPNLCIKSKCQSLYLPPTKSPRMPRPLAPPRRRRQNPLRSARPRNRNLPTRKPKTGPKRNAPKRPDSTRRGSKRSMRNAKGEPEFFFFSFFFSPTLFFFFSARGALVW